MPYTPPSTLSSTPYKNFAESSNKNNSGRPPISHTQSRYESGRDGRNSKAFPNGTSSMEAHEAHEAEEIIDPMSRIQTKGKDQKRESTSGPYDSLYLIDNNPIIDATTRQTGNLGTDGPETSSSSPWMVRQLAVHSIVNPPEQDRVLKSKLHYSSSGEDSIQPTRRGVPAPPKFEDSMDEGKKEEASSGTSPFSTWPSYDYPIQLIRSPRYYTGHDPAPTPSPRGYYRPEYQSYCSPFVNSYPFAATPSPRYMDAMERKESQSDRYRRARSRPGPPPLPRPVTFKRLPRYTSEGIHSTSYDSSSLAERWRSIQRRYEALPARRYGRTYYDCYYTTTLRKGPTQCKLWSKKDVPKETENVQFQYQDPPQTFSKPQDNGANSRGRILAQGRKKRGPGKKTQHRALDSSLDLSASAEERSREDGSPSRTETQLIGRHKLSNWKLHDGKSKDWRRKPSAKTLTARQFLAAIYSPKQLHYSTVHTESPGMAALGPNIPVAAQRSRNVKRSRVVRNEFPAFLPWLDRKGLRDMGMKRHHMRDTFNEGEFEVEAHRKLELRPELPAETGPYMGFYAHVMESNRQLQFLQACPSAKISQDANPPRCLQFHYIGRVIPSPHGSFQLLEHIESLAHAEVYRICYLYTCLESFAAIYTLRGIHPNQRKRRVENLKKFSRLDKLLTAFDWEGKKVCVFSYRYEIEYTSPFKEVSTPKATGIGAIGRRNTKEYNAAFPPLPPSTPIPIPIPRNVPEEATEPLTPEQQLQIKTLEAIKSEIEETNPKRWKSISKKPLPLAQRLMIRLMDLTGESVAQRNSEWKVRNCGAHMKNEGNEKWNEDEKGKDLEVKIKKRGRKKKSGKKDL